MTFVKIIGSILLMAVALVALIAISVGTTFVAIFGDIAIWIVRIVLIVIIGKLLWKLVVRP